MSDNRNRPEVEIRSVTDTGCRRRGTDAEKLRIAEVSFGGRGRVADGGMAAAGVICAIRSHGANLFNFGDLTRQFRQHGAITVATGGEFHSPDVRGGRIHGQMNLAPLAATLNCLTSTPMGPNRAI